LLRRAAAIVDSGVAQIGYSAAIHSVANVMILPIVVSAVPRFFLATVAVGLIDHSSLLLSLGAVCLSVSRL
jgi:hypothetical protein